MKVVLTGATGFVKIFNPQPLGFTCGMRPSAGTWRGR